MSQLPDDGERNEREAGLKRQDGGECVRVAGDHGARMVTPP